MIRFILAIVLLFGFGSIAVAQKYDHDHRRPGLEVPMPPNCYDNPACVDDEDEGFVAVPDGGGFGVYRKGSGHGPGEHGGEHGDDHDHDHGSHDHGHRR
jgi:hypothetical protein